MKNSWRNLQSRAQIVLPVVKKHDSIIVFDTETTGLGTSAKIIQFSAIKYRINADLSLEPETWMNQYINPEEKLEQKIIDITGITDEMLETQPTEKEVGIKIYEFLNQSNLWGIYNAQFDCRMLDQMSERIHISYMKPYIIDILDLARDVVPKTKVENHKLITVSNYLFPNSNFLFHSAIDDVKASAQCLDVFLHVLSDALLQEPEIKRQLHLEWASFSVNPHQPSQKRIKICFDKDKKQYGDIFWDVINKCWSCKATAQAKRLFESCDLQNLEQQVLARYGYIYHANDMDTLASNWDKAKRQKNT